MESKTEGTCRPTETAHGESLDFIKSHIKSYPDFPKPGIVFRDFFSLLGNVEAFQKLHDVLIEHVKITLPNIQGVVALDARGFILGPILALHFGVPFVPIRKKGKLPGQVEQVTYKLEYGNDTFEIQANSITNKQKVIIVDDLLATGGSLEAGCQLLHKLGAEVLQCLVVIELLDLKGREKISAPVHSLVQF